MRDVATMANSTLSQTNRSDVAIHAMPIQQRIDWLIHHADRRSQEFKTPKSRLARSRDHANHPTDIVTFKGMDGRIWVICIGRWFARVHMPSLAFFIHSYSPDLADPIRKAAGLIEANMRAGRITDDGFLLFAETPYREIGVDHARTQRKSRFLSGFAADVIRTEFPEPAEKMHVLTAVLDWQSRAMERIDGQAA